MNSFKQNTNRPFQVGDQVVHKYGNGMIYTISRIEGTALFFTTTNEACWYEGGFKLVKSAEMSNKNEVIA